jgi:hypothetical protein
MSRIHGISIPGSGSYIGIITAINGTPARGHLPAKEHDHPDQERGSHDQRWRQRLQIGKHGASQLVPGCSCEPPEGIVTHLLAAPRLAPGMSGSPG